MLLLVGLETIQLKMQLLQNSLHKFSIGARYQLSNGNERFNMRSFVKVETAGLAQCHLCSTVTLADCYIEAYYLFVLITNYMKYSLLLLLEHRGVFRTEIFKSH